MNLKKLLTESVISTVSPRGQPEVAVIEFGETDDLELIFDAFEKSRKVQNIKQNNRVAGETFELSGEELGKYKKIYLAKNPAVVTTSASSNLAE